MKILEKKKKPKDEKNEQKECSEAQEVVLVSNQYGVKINGNPQELLEELNGMLVEEGFVVKEFKNKSEEGFTNFLEDPDFGRDILDEFFDSSRLKLIVKKTIPLGLVKITEKTKIKVEDKKLESKDIPSSKIIEVIQKPDLNDYIKVKSISEIKKLIDAGHFINKFKTKTKTIYFSNPYFFEEKNN